MASIIVDMQDTVYTMIPFPGTVCAREFSAHAIPGAVEQLLAFHEAGHRVVIFSRSEEKVTWSILHDFISQKGGDPAILDTWTIYNANHFGGKAKPEGWVLLFSKHPDAVAVYDDEREYLSVAQEAAERLGMTLRFYDKLESANSIS